MGYQHKYVAKRCTRHKSIRLYTQLRGNADMQQLLLCGYNFKLVKQEFSMTSHTKFTWLKLKLKSLNENMGSK